MKRLVAALLLLVLFLLPACQARPENPPVSSSETTEPVTTEPETEAESTEPAPVLPGVDPDYEGEFFVLYLRKDEEIQFERAPVAPIDIYRWGQKYMPVAYAQILFREGDGFYVKMHCEEENPRAEYTNFGDPVYNDSALEFFCDYYPAAQSGYYINTEMNANGAFLTYWAHGMGKYEKMKDKTAHLPEVTAFRDETGWGVVLHVSLEMLADLYPGITWQEESQIACNFYKCGSKCEIPHYGTWKEVLTETPNFHMPEYFGMVSLLRTPKQASESRN